MIKNKIFNDPVYGFITIPGELIYQIIEHPLFQRLRRIRQMGLAEMVYPGAIHTRFNHALGSMHIMQMTLDSLRGKGVEISAEEYEGSLIAALLHDIGHGPFSHTLENLLTPGATHEEISSLLISEFNKHFNGELDISEKIYNNTYARKFFNQLVSSQLDVDRLDYLKRDSFYTGVLEGTIGTERIIKMLDIVDDNLVVEEKGIYSIENLLSARRLMYWQVYLHKAAVCAEKMMVQILLRAKELYAQNEKIHVDYPLKRFLENEIGLPELKNEPGILHEFTQMDDYDIIHAVKIWMNQPDRVLAALCKMLLERKLFKIKISGTESYAGEARDLSKKLRSKFGLRKDEVNHLVLRGTITNAAYITNGKPINIIKRNGEIVNIAEASDLPNIKAMSKIVKKYYLCRPKNLIL